MAINWGAYDGHLRVGIDHVISPASPSHSDTTVDVTWKFYVGTDGWNFNDDQVLHESADGWGGLADGFHNGLTSGSMLVGTHKETYGISSNSPSKSASANLTGAYNGATPSKSVTVNLPNRPPAPPPPDTAPSGGENPVASAITATSATLSWSPPVDDGGDAIDNYELQVSTASGFTTTVYDVSANNRSRSVTGLSANTTYYARVRAHNSVGWGAWTGATNCAFTTSATLPGTPTGVTTSNVSQNSMTVSWPAVAENGGGAVTYSVDISLTSTFPAPRQLAPLPNPIPAGYSEVYTGALSYTFTNVLAANTTYYIRVTATNTLGQSGWSTTISRTTLASSTYTDSGDYVTMVNNLAKAVADKMMHLGTFIHRGRTSAYTTTAGNWTTFDLNVSLDTCPMPDPPTYAAGGTITIQYPGTYYVEFITSYPAGDYLYHIEVNGTTLEHPSSTNPKGGYAGEVPDSSTRGRGKQVTLIRRLAVGDTIAFRVYNDTAASKVTDVLTTSDLIAHARVTMIGF